MPLARLTRRPLHGRPRKGRVSTPAGWFDIDTTTPLDVIEGDIPSGAVHALVAQGWSLERVAAPADPTPTPDAPAASEGAPAAEDAAPSAPPAPPADAAPETPTPIPADADLAALTFDEVLRAAPVLTDAQIETGLGLWTVREIEALAERFTGAQLATALRIEAAGRKRKGALAALGAG